MERVGVAHLAYRPFPLLSGGEQQLVLIARAVASGSPAMVLDEPAAGLDLRNQGQVLVLVQALVSEGMSVLFTTHHPDHALFVADSVVLMHDRDTVRCGRVEELLTDANLSSLYGVPVSSVWSEAGGTRRRTLVVGYQGYADRDVDPPGADRPAGPVKGPLTSRLSRRGRARDRSAPDHR
jgi:iron complex transport system ATP-binding protein